MAGACRRTPLLPARIAPAQSSAPPGGAKAGREGGTGTPQRRRQPPPPPRRTWTSAISARRLESRAHASCAASKSCRSRCSFHTSRSSASGTRFQSAFSVYTHTWREDTGKGGGRGCDTHKRAKVKYSHLKSVPNSNSTGAHTHRRTRAPGTTQSPTRRTCPRLRRGRRTTDRARRPGPFRRPTRGGAARTRRQA